MRHLLLVLCSAALAVAFVPDAPGRAPRDLLKSPTRQLHQAVIPFNPFLKKAERQGGLKRTVHSGNGSLTTNGHECTRMMKQIHGESE